jgi:hypothetical protein
VRPVVVDVDTDEEDFVTGKVLIEQAKLNEGLGKALLAQKPIVVLGPNPTRVAAPRYVLEDAVVHLVAVSIALGETKRAPTFGYLSEEDPAAFLRGEDGALVVGALHVKHPSD